MVTSRNVCRFSIVYIYILLLLFIIVIFIVIIIIIILYNVLNSDVACCIVRLQCCIVKLTMQKPEANLK